MTEVVKPIESTDLLTAEQWDAQYSHAFRRTENRTAICGYKRQGESLHPKPTRELCPICAALLKFG